MAWRKRTEHLDPISQTHVIRLHDPDRSADPAHDHILQVSIGSKACPHCGRPWAENDEEHDPIALTTRVTHHLERLGQRAKAYAKRHGIPLKR